MLTTITTGAFQVAYKDIAIPQPTAGEVLIRMKRAGICASDVQVYHGLHKYVSFPIVQGHEGGGFVEAVGADVEGISVGDLVVVQPQLACGHCFACRQQRENVCETLRHFGISHPGLFAEYVSVPAWNAVKVPSGMDIDYCALIEPFSIACNAVEKGDIRPGHRVVVIGAGFIGNLVAQACTIAGAEVLITDVLPQKLELAKQNGIAHTLNTAEQPLKDEIARVFGDQGVHVIYECAALPATFAQAVECASKASRIVIVGNFKKPVTFEIPSLQRREIALMSVMGTSRKNFLESIALLSQNKVSLAGMVSGHFPLNALDKAYQFIDERGDTMKVILDINE